MLLSPEKKIKITWQHVLMNLRALRYSSHHISVLARHMSSTLPSYRLASVSPNPLYTPGASSPPPFPHKDQEDFTTILPGNVSADYKLLISAVTPRPIAFISTKGQDGICNLSPYSFFNAMGHDPPTLTFGCVARRASSDGMSDTHRNLLDTKVCCVHIISDWMVEAANHSCGAYDPEVDEIPLTGLTTIPCKSVDVPRIKECAVAMECSLEASHEIKNGEGKVTSTIMICRVLATHVNNHVYDAEKGVVDTALLRPISRLGGDTYGQVSGCFDLPRPNKDGSLGELRFG